MNQPTPGSAASAQETESTTEPTAFGRDILPALHGTGLIWAQTTSGIIGNAGTMPWHIPEDLKHFSALTSGSPVIMGRKTWLSFPPKYRPLPGRTNIVVTRSADWAHSEEAAGAVVVPSLPEAFTKAGEVPVTWVIGGGDIYAQTLPDADFAVVTLINSEVPGDTLAPQIPADWNLSNQFPAMGWLTSRTGTQYRFTLWTRPTTSPESTP